MQHAFDISSLTVTVIGAARSGVAAALLLRARGVPVFLSEYGPAARCGDAAARLQADGIPSEFGGHSERVHEADLLVVSPGVPGDAPVLLEAERRGIPVISEVELGTMFLDVPIVALTGTNGKTTTTTLTGLIYEAGGMRPMVAGNIGRAFCAAIMEQGSETGAAVLEVSSFQLDTCVSFHPHIAAITTITPDHLYRYHGDFMEYVASKQRIFMNQGADDFLIYNYDDVVVDGAVKTARAQVMPVSSMQRLRRGGWLQEGQLVLDTGDGRESIAHVDELQVQGRHNYQNVLMASLAGRLGGVTMDAVREAVRAFRGVEHRLEFVCDIDGVSWINDSKATNVDSVVIALQSVRRPVILIAGGRDKGAPYDPLFDLVREKVRSMILIGEAADRLEHAFAGRTTIVRARDMQEAVNVARVAARPGDVALLSPACASFDMYESFEHRGRDFKECVRSLCKAA
jgi:UDP-N-acetylmuramoylalanine--D-glutamate ligase